MQGQARDMWGYMVMNDVNHHESCIKRFNRDPLFVIRERFNYYDRAKALNHWNKVLVIRP